MDLLSLLDNGGLMFSDTHCHIYKEYYEDIDEVIDTAIKNKIDRIINNATNRENMDEVLQLSKKYNGMYCAIGYQPEDIDVIMEEDLKYLESHLKDDKVIAIGEIGLDYHYTKENKKKQIYFFEKQLELAEKYSIPVIIHSRDATLDTIETLKKYKVKGVIHSFSGSLETAKEYIKQGFLLGINGVITFKNCKLSEVCKELSLEHIVLETDSPYLTPVPFRGKQNNPSHIVDIATYVCDLYNVSLETLATETNRNIKRIFDI